MVVFRSLPMVEAFMPGVCCRRLIAEQGLWCLSAALKRLVYGAWLLCARWKLPGQDQLLTPHDAVLILNH